MLQWFIKFPEFTEITEFNESSTSVEFSLNGMKIQWIQQIRRIW